MQAATLQEYARTAVPEQLHARHKKGASSEIHGASTEAVGVSAQAQQTVHLGESRVLRECASPESADLHLVGLQRAAVLKVIGCGKLAKPEHQSLAHVVKPAG